MAGARSAQPALIEYLQEWKLNGNNIILWTCRVGEALSNNAGNKTSNLMPSMTTFRKSSNSTDTTAARYPATTISMTGCCFRKMQRHRTRNGAMPLCLFCNIQFYFCCLGKFFFSVQQFIFLLFRQAVENFLVTKKRRSIHSHVLTAINNPSAIFHHFLTFPYSLFSFPVEFVSPVLFFLSQTSFPVFSLLPSPSDTVPLIPDTLSTVLSCPP